MKPRVIPVIDILHGQVVRGVGGRRHEYRPIASTLTDSTEPLTVANAMLAATGAKEIYVADLDAIMHGRPPSNAVFKVDANIWLDAGTMKIEPLPANVTPILPGESFVPERLVDLNSSTIFSIDLMNGVLMGDALNSWLTERGVLTPRGSLSRGVNTPRSVLNETVVGCVRLIRDYGIHRFIILDVYEVGERRGLNTLPICRSIKERFPDTELVSGGGIRDADDLKKAADAGVDAVLISTAIHDGTLH